MSIQEEIQEVQKSIVDKIDKLGINNSYISISSDGKLLLDGYFTSKALKIISKEFKKAEKLLTRNK